MIAAASSLCMNLLPIGSKGLVTDLSVEGPMRRRLFDLGLVPGTEVVALRTSPFGDPTAYLIRGAMIALRQEESRLVQVMNVGGGSGKHWI